MQVQKDEVRQKIIEVAQDEFLRHGYKNASMRVIAKKAHTTLGNIYNYFINKEEIFDAVIGDIPEVLERFIYDHEQKEEAEEELTLEQMKVLMYEFMPQALGFDILLSIPFVILMECSEGTKYEGYQKRFYNMAYEHMTTHIATIFPDKKHELLAATLTQGFISATLFIARKKKSLEEGIEELVNFLVIMISGLVAVDKSKKEGREKDDQSK